MSRCFICGGISDETLTALCLDCGAKGDILRAAWRKSAHGQAKLADWRISNREHLNRYYKKHRGESIAFRIAGSLRTRLGSAIRRHLAGTKRIASAVRDLGCTMGQLCAHLEAKFQDGMSWANYGDWHIDHVRPLSAFDLTDEEQQRQACHFSNLQPLWAKDNLAKGCRYDN